MIRNVRDLARKWLEGKEVDAIFGLKEQDSYIAPYLFTDASELDNLTISTEYRLCYTCRPPKENILALTQRREPNTKIGIVARGCEERALVELAKRGQVDLDKVKIMGIACTEDEAKECRCERPYPNNLVMGVKVPGVEGVSGDENINALLNKSLPERLEFWRHELSKCVKCYGCRDACPICYCKDCTLEADRGVVMPGEVPPDAMFPMLRIAHVMDSCVNCGQCQDVCSANIPLARLTFMLNKELYDIFKYQPGVDVKTRPPLRSVTDSELAIPGVEVAF